MEETETKYYGLRGAVFHEQEIYQEGNRDEGHKEEISRETHGAEFEVREEVLCPGADIQDRQEKEFLLCMVKVQERNN